MNLLLTIKSLYAVNGVVAVLLYLPQICKAWKDKDHALSLSLVSFGGWSLGSLVTALYAWLHIKDRIFTAVSLGNMAGSGAVFVIVACGRLGSRGSALPGIAAAPLLPPASPARHEADRVAGLAQQLP